MSGRMTTPKMMERNLFLRESFSHTVQKTRIAKLALSCKVDIIGLKS